MAEVTVANAFASEVASLEDALRVRAASQMIVIRLAIEHSALHRYWKLWAVVASLLLREAGGALVQLELTKQQHRGAHTRLQAEMGAELAKARVENLEARALLSKAEIISQLDPAHELVVDKEMIIEQRRAMQAAHESAAAAHLAAAAHRVGEETLMGEVREAEDALTDTSASSRRRALDEGARAREELEARMHYERSSLDFITAEHTHTTAELRRARCEMRVLVRSLQIAEADATPPPRITSSSLGPRPRPSSPGRVASSSASATSSAHSPSGQSTAKPAARQGRPPRPR
uniref:Uncharacterized protein n=1 Tax=Haptolina brevifila TaxID=156173 RepID=A0A7S2C5N3_9EUKA